MKFLSLYALLFTVANSTVASTTNDIAPIELSSLASGYAPGAIRNTLAIYTFAIDGKDFNALSKIFTTDVIVNYSAPLNVLTPLETIQSVLSLSLGCVTTQHLYGTQRIDILSPITAKSVTYFRAAHFGKGDKENEVDYAYGQYQGNWQRQATGTWRIVHRNFVYMVSAFSH
ncbi:hypothetical protein N7465_007858 [Penicillium sp. CMV-2018d]|nr:hypothetical protein N7465_007858 [Penicillium sp. CMV-2018d]